MPERPHVLLPRALPPPGGCAIGGEVGQRKPVFSREMIAARSPLMLIKILCDDLARRELYRGMGRKAPSIRWSNERDGKRMRKLISRFRRDEDGPAMVEYGLLVGLIALVVALGAIVLGQDISIMFSKVASY